MVASTLENNLDSVSTATSLLLRPPAKINLSLLVYDKRPDGYHDLHSLMATINLHDKLNLEITDRPGIQLICQGLPCPTTSDNLVVRAAQQLAQYAGLQPALRLSLTKRIPAGAGLGGASSDAAACLWGLNRLWRLDLPTEELDYLAASLGSDVPFFLHGPVALCTGRGEIVRPLPLRCRMPILLILPDIHTPTSLVYQNYTFQPDRMEEDIRLIRYYLRLGDLDGLLFQGINSLTEVTMTLFEPLRCLRKEIRQWGIAPVHMSGSGSALFVPGRSLQQLKHWGQLIWNRSTTPCRVVHVLDRELYDSEADHADYGDTNQTG